MGERRWCRIGCYLVFLYISKAWIVKPSLHRHEWNTKVGFAADRSASFIDQQDASAPEPLQKLWKKISSTTPSQEKASLLEPVAYTINDLKLSMATNGLAGSGADPHRWLHQLLLSLQEENPQPIDSDTVDQLITSFCYILLSSPASETMGHEVASFLSGLARLGVPWSAMGTRRYLCIVLEQAIASAFPNELSAIVHSLGELQVNQAHDLPSTLTTTLLHRLSSALIDAPPRVLSCTLWGLKECRFHWQQFPVALRQRIVDGVVAFNGQESRQATANSLLALAQLGFRYPRDLSMRQQTTLQTQWQRLPQRSMAFVDMVQIFHALGTMQCPWSSLHADTHFALGEAWFAAVQREIQRANTDNAAADMTSAAPVEAHAVASIAPSTVGLVLHQLAVMNATWMTLPSALKAGLQLAVIYVSSDDAADDGPTTATTTRSVATIVHSLARLGVSWAQLHEQAQRSLFRVLLGHSRSSGSRSGSRNGSSDKRRPPRLRGRSLAALLVGFAELHLTWDRDLPLDVQQELWTSLLHHATSATTTASVAVTQTATTTAATAVVPLVMQRQRSPTGDEASSTPPSRPHENTLQVLFTSLNAMLQLQFPFDTLQQRHPHFLEALLTSALTQAATAAAAPRRTTTLRDLIVGGWTLVQLGRRGLWRDADTTDTAAATTATTAAAAAAAATSMTTAPATDRRREALLPLALQTTYLQALACHLQGAAAVGDDHRALIHHLLYEDRLAADELVLLLKVLGNLRVSVRTQAACIIPPPNAATAAAATAAATATATATPVRTSLLTVTKTMAAWIFANDRHTTLTDVVLTIDALANMGHTWTGMPPNLQRKILTAYPRYTWNRGSLTCLFVWSLGRLRYPWQCRDDDKSSTTSTSASAVAVDGTTTTRVQWQRRLLDDVHAALMAGAVTNARSWASLLRGLAALHLCLPTTTEEEEESGAASIDTAWTPLPLDLSQTLVQRLWQATVAPGDGHIDEDIEADAAHDGGTSRSCLWHADAASLRHVTCAWSMLSHTHLHNDHSSGDEGPATTLPRLRSSLRRTWQSLAPRLSE